MLVFSIRILSVVGGKNGSVGAPEPSTIKSRPSTPDTLTRGSVSWVDALLPAGGEVFAGSVGWMVEAVCEEADGRAPFDATL